MKEQKYIGRIVSVPGGDGIGFIGIASVSKDAGASHKLDTMTDIFVHRDDCASDLRVGMELSFSVIPDKKRGGKNYRAMGAVEHVESELISGELVEFENMSLARVGPEEMKLARLPVHGRMKPVSEVIVEKVIANLPLPTVRRDGRQVADQEVLLAAFLKHLFPSLELFGTDYDVVKQDDGALDASIAQVVADHVALGMADQITHFREEVERFKTVRSALSFIREEGLVRNDAIIPIKYLPDFTMAVPVWFFWTADDNVDVRSRETDPMPEKCTEYFCDLFPNNRWADTFQMFNRRTRSLRMYKGDMIPPHVMRRIRKAVTMFDYVVIMTPYLDIAGSDWQDDTWLRSIDPYVVGFKKGVPYFFVLARFSDSGTFPLFNELLADTMEYLRINIEKLRRFDTVTSPYWYQDREVTSGSNLGSRLVSHTKKLLEAFDEGNLFDWLRGEESISLTKKR